METFIYHEMISKQELITLTASRDGFSLILGVSNGMPALRPWRKLDIRFAQGSEKGVRNSGLLRHSHFFLLI